MPNTYTFEPRAPERLSGVLKAGTVFAPSGTATERIYTGAASSIAVRVKCSAIVGTLTVALNPMLSDAGVSTATGTAATAL